jgi:hypothetical protein
MVTEPAPRIRDYVEVRRHPTVVRLQDLDGSGCAWLEETFVLTTEVQSHLAAVARLLGRGTGSGVFVIGQYGSGKSHLLAYLTLRLRTGAMLERPPDVVPVSLVNYSATNRLEDIISTPLGVRVAAGDRRPAWEASLSAHGNGVLLIIDELSEFLRAKRDGPAFNEDVRFLQFLGEWAQDRPFWIVAALQEGIEHTGEIEYGLYRKIKDRYPLRLILTPGHVRSLIADGILVKKPGYDAAAEQLCRNLREVHGDSTVDLGALRAIYPIHPSTLELLEEVRDRFSQARGVVDFTATRLAGDAARGIEPFLDRPFGSLVTPDVIVDHFQDLLEIQPEFLPISQQLFPWHRRHLAEIFELPAQRELAEKLLKLLVLAHLSAAREGLTAEEAAAWLLVSAARVEPDRNRKIVERLLATLADRGRYVVARGGRYGLDLGDDGGAALERLLTREKASLQGQDALVLETIVGLVPASGFNPFQLPRDQWQHRCVLWHFHERRYAVWLGNDDPSPIEGIGLCLRLPWAATAPPPNLYTVQPSPIPATPELVELAALLRLRERPGPPDLEQRIEQRVHARAHLAERALRSAWQEAELIAPEGKREPAPRLAPQSTLDSWLETIALWMLRRTYPAFERFAPGHGPLPKDAWLRFMRFAAAEDIGAAEADDYVKLIREAYLVPMGLLRRRGREYVTPANLDQNELVRLVTPLLEHGPAPRAVHAHLAEPVYGLVCDQTNLLLVFLLLQGAIDIIKERRSYRESFELLPNPVQYDRIVAGHALSDEQIRALEQLCDALAIKRPAHWTVLTQRRAAAQLSEVRRRAVDRLQPLVRQLGEVEQGRALAERVEQHIDRWNAVEKGHHELQGLQQFLFEIGSPSAFLDEVRFFESLPSRVQHLLTETRRYAHLLQHPAVRQSVASDDLGVPPGLEEPERLDEWLQRTARAYLSYRTSYGERHDRWWREIADHPLWAWQGPAVARSRHVDLADALREIEGCRREADRYRCRGLVNLDYQAQCTCGFDGETAPIEALLGRFDALRETIETRLRLFFQQDGVKARLRRWQRDGMEVTEGTLSYLEGDCSVPEVHDLSALDEYLAGADVAADVELESIVETLQQRLWEPSELIDTLARQIRARGGRRLRFTGRVASGIPHDVLEWCAEQSARHGVRLPAGLSRDELCKITKALRPEWVGAAAVRELETLGLDKAGVDRVLGWLADGTLALPERRWRDDAVVRVVVDLRSGHQARTPQELAVLSARSYRAHPRLQRVVGRRWLEHLDAVARSPLDPLPRLVEILKERDPAQWLVIDALGLPLLEALKPVLTRLMAEWRSAELSFGEASPATTTDAWYADLLGAGLIASFEKVNVIDELLHGDFAPFVELVALSAVRLEGALGRVLPKLAPERPLVLFADHGFRLAEDGRAYVHGGTSTLERVVPVWSFVPRERGSARGRRS